MLQLFDVVRAVYDWVEQDFGPRPADVVLHRAVGKAEADYWCEQESRDLVECGLGQEYVIFDRPHKP